MYLLSRAQDVYNGVFLYQVVTNQSASKSKYICNLNKFNKTFFCNLNSFNKTFFLSPSLSVSFCLVNQMEIVSVINIKYCNGICWVNTKTVNTKSSVKIYQIELSFGSCIKVNSQLCAACLQWGN